MCSKRHFTPRNSGTLRDGIFSAGEKSSRIGFVLSKIWYWTSTWILEHLQIYLHIRWFLGQTFWCYTVHQWSQRAVRQLTLYLTFSTSSRTFGGSGAWPLLILTTSRWLFLSEVYFTKFFSEEIWEASEKSLWWKSYNWIQEGNLKSEPSHFLFLKS